MRIANAFMLNFLNFNTFYPIFNLVFKAYIQ